MTKNKKVLRWHLDGHLKTEKEFARTYPLVTIQANVYDDGSVLYDLESESKDGTKTSDGLYTEIQVISKLLAMMGVTKEPRFYIPPYQPEE